MILKRRASGSTPAPRRWLSRLTAGLGLTAAAITLAAGCLDRPVEPQDPSTSNVYVAEIRQTAVDKIDLLFMIDNSISMADKQAILQEAVPVLLQRLVTPICVTPDGTDAGGPATGDCPNGSEREFSAIRDIHIGVVTSSLGAHGGDVCVEPKDDDKAHLVGTPGLRMPMTGALTSWNNSGFLAWDPDTMRPRNNPPGERDAGALVTAFQNHVAATGENGCGYEASLEAWYRFLVDPQPPSQVGRVTDPATGAPLYTGVVYDPPDTTILAQRAAFLRPDSLVAIIMLTDENDCSIRDDGQGWLVGLQQFPPGSGQRYLMPRSHSACDTNPNHECCVSCDADPRNVPGSCNIGADPKCALGKYTSMEDNPNLRCWDQKRRFGFDLLYGIEERYLPALTSTTIPSRDIDPATGQAMIVANPLFAGSPPRDPSLIFLAGIVGVPWQDIATADTLNDPNRLEYMTYKELNDNGRWQMILGTPGTATTNPIPPTDALMIETTADRSASPPHPVIGAALAPPTAPANANPINGHESSIADNSDLQFACTFPLTTPRMCADGQLGCDCKTEDQVYNRSLCQGTTQTHAKAYPGTRHLQLLNAVGQRTGNAIVASICPKSTNPAQGQAYGYTPAVAAIIDRLKEALRGKCLPRRLDVDATTGAVPCVVVEAQVPAGGMGCAPCEANPGRGPADERLTPAVHRQLEASGYCTTGEPIPNIPACNQYCLCQINQFAGAELDRCQTQATAPNDIFGYCYVDPSAIDPAGPNAGDIPAQEAIVASCPSTQRRLLRFTGDNVPARGAIALIACIGASISDAPTATIAQ